MADEGFAATPERFYGMPFEDVPKKKTTPKPAAKKAAKMETTEPDAKPETTTKDEGG